MAHRHAATGEHDGNDGQAVPVTEETRAWVRADELDWADDWRSCVRSRRNRWSRRSEWAPAGPGWCARTWSTRRRRTQS